MIYGTAFDGLAAGDRMIIIKVPRVLLSRDDSMLLFRSLPSSGPDGALAAETTCLHLCHAVEERETYIYCPAVSRHARYADASGSGDDLSRLRHVARSRYAKAEVDVFEVTQRVEGASAARVAKWHYVVETNVLPEAESNFNAWYAQEHLPGLAAVPGTVQAIRLRNITGSPRYHALYLLESRETFGSDPWLKVRATDWSSRVRPSFINTKRTMFGVQTG